MTIKIGPHNAILLSNKKEEPLETCYNRNESQNVMLSRISNTNVIYCMIPHMLHLGKGKTNTNRKQICGARDMGRGFMKGQRRNLGGGGHVLCFD